MRYALVDGKRVSAFRGAKGTCPHCHGPVIARCGTILVWHWAHVSRSDCDSWAEGETPWHLEWKRRFPRQWREVTVRYHRADIKSPQGVIELQASSISPEEIQEREQFYGEMVWVLNARDFKLKVRDKGHYVTFRWKHPRKTWWSADRQLFFDRGDGTLLKVHNLHANVPCGGSGRIISYDEFVKAYSQVRQGQALCHECNMPFPLGDLKETGMYEYLTLDVDCGEFICFDCYERLCEARIPDDPSLVDVLTPYCSAASF